MAGMAWFAFWPAHQMTQGVCGFDAKRLAGIDTATLVRGSDQRSPSGGTPDPIAGRRKAASKGCVAFQLVVNRGAPVWVRPDPGLAGANRSSGPIGGSNGRESLRAPDCAAVAPAVGDERPEIVPVARFQRRTPRPWRGWWQARPDLTPVKSSKHQPQRRDVTSDSVKI